MFKAESFVIPSDAVEVILVEGLPLDCTEREVAHIFRPFPGFKNVKLSKNNSEGVSKSSNSSIFCYVEFENAQQTTVVINTIQVSNQFFFEILGISF
jgi:RNA recognition motif-containing protein